MEKSIRGSKIYLDKDKKVESFINSYLGCRDGIVEVYEYNDCSGYGSQTRLFLCDNTKHESTSIVRQVWTIHTKEWIEEVLAFDSDSFEMLKSLIIGDTKNTYGKYSLIRDYSIE